MEKGIYLTRNSGVWEYAGVKILPAELVQVCAFLCNVSMNCVLGIFIFKKFYIKFICE